MSASGNVTEKKRFITTGKRMGVVKLFPCGFFFTIVFHGGGNERLKRGDT